MKKWLFFIPILFFSVPFLYGENKGSQNIPLRSTLSDQQNISVTIYNSDLGLVKDVRKIKMASGEQRLEFMDVASRINPVSVHIRSLTNENKLHVLEQNYEYDLLNPLKLADKYVGKKVKLLKVNDYTGAKELRDAELLSIHEGTIFRMDGEIYVNPEAQIIYPEIPGNLIAKPTLIWFLNNEGAQEQTVEASYLTSGMSWQADYTAVLNDESDQCDWSGWVTIQNQSGATYSDAKIKLVAGDINRAYSKNDILYAKSAMSSMRESDSAFREESFFEYHLYTLNRPSTLKENQTKQIELLSVDQIPVIQRLIYYGAQDYYRNQWSGQVMSNQKIGAYIELENKKENKLGIPLPKGIVRVYKRDQDGTLQFVGEDQMNHTPKDEKIKIKMGDAFDVIGERKQMDYKILTKNSSQRFDVEQAWEVTVRNHKDKPSVVEVIEPMGGQWEMAESSHPYEKIDVNTVKFVLKLEKEENQTIKYRVRIRWY